MRNTSQKSNGHKNIETSIQEYPKSLVVTSFTLGLVSGVGLSYFFFGKDSERNEQKNNMKSIDRHSGNEKVKTIMSYDPAACTGATELVEVARQMLENDCGAIPVVDSMESYRPIGIITDRDIVIRTLAESKNPLNLTATDCMTPETISVHEDDTISECTELMKKNQVRRILVVNEEGRCIGMVSQADIVLEASSKKAKEVVKAVSKPDEDFRQAV